jgi:hypothetical protein
MTQNQEILKHLKTGATITPLEALNMFGTLRLAGRIFDLKQKGWPIFCESLEVEENKRVGRYYLHPDKEHWPDQ